MSKLKQFFNPKTQKWHILEHHPESKSRIKWKVRETRDLKHPDAEITGRFQPKPSEPVESDESDISDTSSKQKQNKEPEPENESSRSKGFLGIF